jgi:large subunit ribosomal protein L30
LSSRKLKVTLTRSTIGLKPGHVRTLEALGLRRIRATVVHDDTPVIRGMIARVPYAVRVEPAEEHAMPAAGQGRPRPSKASAMSKTPNMKERSA